uniref:Venom peptide n=1 Tax=Gongylonema pulchrum TaxID=637853 RepID=A0A183EYP8_9BILA
LVIVTKMIKRKRNDDVPQIPRLAKMMAPMRINQKEAKRRCCSISPKP